MPAKTVNSKSTKQETVAAAPATETKKTTASKKVTATVEAAPATPAPVAQKGGKKVAATPAAPAPVVEAAPVAAPKAKAVKATVEAKATVEKVQKAGAKKAAAPKKEAAVEKPAKQPKAAKKVVEAEADAEDADGEKGVRSFKVQLPGNEDFTGRFTGLTPYQAANKALSKYFRENKSAMNEITFSIRESTRGSKRSTYTYNGKREKLATPVKYSIKSQDGGAREIVKEYKNKLTKVKKSETKSSSA